METPSSMFRYDMPCQLDDYVSTQDPYHPFQIPDLAYADSKFVDVSQISSLSPALSSSTLSWATCSTAMTSPSQSSRSQSLSSPPFQTCNCFQTIMPMLSTMQQLSEPRHTNFEVALNHSREAVALSLSTLKCRCARESSVVLLVGSLIAKIISCYERHCGAVRNNP
jgi:hypothetical protein